MRRMLTDRGRRSRAFLQCASCRFAVFYFVPFFAGLVEAGSATLFLAAFGALFWLVQSLAIEVTNRLADRVEDEINRPERTALCEIVGWATLRRAQWLLWGASIGLAAAWLAVDGSPLLAFTLACCFAVGFAYSRGPRFSRSRVFAFFTLNMLFGGSFLVGWAAGDPFAAGGPAAWHQLESFAPMLFAVGVFILALAGIKDITDREGDLAVGYESPFVALVRDRAGLAPLALATAPFAVTVAFAATGVLPGRMAALALFAPVSALLVIATWRAERSADRMIVREAFYDYWLVYSSAAVLAYSPDARLLAVVLGSAAFWLLTTRFLHWGRGLRLRDLLRFQRLLARGGPARALSPAAGA